MLSEKATKIDEIFTDLEKDCFFFGYLIFFGPSYFEMALINNLQT